MQRNLAGGKGEHLEVEGEVEEGLFRAEIVQFEVEVAPQIPNDFGGRVTESLSCRDAAHASGWRHGRIG